MAERRREEGMPPREKRGQKMARPEAESGGMTVEEAGRKGGETVKERYGPEFYSEIGQKGGEARGKEIHEAAQYFKEHPEERPDTGHEAERERGKHR